jgi:nitrite reductase/ring-hydroxylating ferredoxin subunit
VARTKTVDLSALVPDRLTLVTVGKQDVVVVRRGEEICAIGNECPHQGGSLVDGFVEGDIVVCPLHGWEFDLRSGVCMTVPGESVPSYDVTVEDGAVFLEEAP